MKKLFLTLSSLSLVAPLATTISCTDTKKEETPKDGVNTNVNIGVENGNVSGNVNIDTNISTPTTSRESRENSNNINGENSSNNTTNIGASSHTNNPVTNKEININKNVNKVYSKFGFTYQLLKAKELNDLNELQKEYFKIKEELLKNLNASKRFENSLINIYNNILNEEEIALKMVIQNNLNVYMKNKQYNSDVFFYVEEDDREFFDGRLNLQKHDIERINEQNWKMITHKLGLSNNLNNLETIKENISKINDYIWNDKEYLKVEKSRQIIDNFASGLIYNENVFVWEIPSKNIAPLFIRILNKTLGVF